MDTLSRESSSESLVLPAITVQSLCTSHYGGTVQDQLRKASCPALLPALTITQDPDQPAYGTGIYYSPDQPCCEGGVYYTPSSSQRPSWSLQLPTLPCRSPRGSLSSRGRRSSSIIALGYALFDITPVSWVACKILHILKCYAATTRGFYTAACNQALMISFCPASQRSCGRGILDYPWSVSPSVHSFFAWPPCGHLNNKQFILWSYHVIINKIYNRWPCKLRTL